MIVPEWTRAATSPSKYVGAHARTVRAVRIFKSPPGERTLVPALARILLTSPTADVLPRLGWSPHVIGSLRQPDVSVPSRLERAIFAGGRFGSLQSLLRRYPNVVQTRAGYNGGDAPRPTYQDIGSHAEAVEFISGQEGQAIDAFWSSFSRSTTQPHGIARATTSVHAIDPWYFVLRSPKEHRDEDDCGN